MCLMCPAAADGGSTYEYNLSQSRFTCIFTYFMSLKLGKNIKVPQNTIKCLVAVGLSIASPGVFQPQPRHLDYKLLNYTAVCQAPKTNVRINIQKYKFPHPSVLAVRN